MAYQVNFGLWGQIFPVPTALCDRHLKFCSEAQLKVLLLVLRDGQDVINAAAIALYQKHDFAQVGLRKNYYQNPREDAIIMTREFTTDGTEAAE